MLLFKNFRYQNALVDKRKAVLPLMDKISENDDIISKLHTQLISSRNEIAQYKGFTISDLFESVVPTGDWKNKGETKFSFRTLFLDCLLINGLKPSVTDDHIKLAFVSLNYKQISCKCPSVKMEESIVRFCFDSERIPWYGCGLFFQDSSNAPQMVFVQFESFEDTKLAHEVVYRHVFVFETFFGRILFFSQKRLKSKISDFCIFSNNQILRTRKIGNCSVKTCFAKEFPMNIISIHTNGYTKDEILLLFSKYGRIKNVTITQNDPNWAVLTFYDTRDAVVSVINGHGRRVCS